MKFKDVEDTKDVLTTYVLMQAKLVDLFDTMCELDVDQEEEFIKYCTKVIKYLTNRQTDVKKLLK